MDSSTNNNNVTKDSIDTNQENHQKNNQEDLVKTDSISATAEPNSNNAQPDKKSDKQLDKKSDKNPNKKNWLLRLFKNLFYIVLFIIILAASLLYYVLATNSGLVNSIKIVNSLTSAINIKYSELEGNVYHGFAYKNLAIHGDSFDFTSKLGKLNWQLPTFNNRHLQINELSTNDSILNLLKTNTSQTTAPTTSKHSEFNTDNGLPFSIPLTINIKQLNIINFDIKDENVSAINIAKAELSASYQDKVLNLTTLKIDSDLIIAKASGQVTNASHLPITLAADATLYEKDIGKQHVILNATGNLAKLLALKINGDGFITADIDGTIEKLFTKLTYKLDADLKQIDLKKVSGEDMTVSAKLLFTGDLGAAKATGTINYNSIYTKHLTASEVVATASHFIDNGARDLQTTLSAKIASKQYGDIAINAKALGDYYHATKIDYDITQILPSKPQLASTKFPKKSSKTNIVATNIIPNIVANLTQNINQNAALQTTNNQATPTIRGTTDLQSHPDFEIKNNLVINQLNTEPALKGSKALINAKLMVNAEITNDIFSSKILLENLSGSINKEPISGKIDIITSGKDLFINNLKLNLAGNILDASGKIQNTSADIKFAIDAKQLNKIYQPISGNITAKGSILGKLEFPKLYPALKLDLKASNVDIFSQKINTLNVVSDIDQKANKLNLKALGEQLKIANQEVNNININIDGKITNHNSDIQIKTPNQSLDLKANTGIDIANMIYTGSLSKLIFNDKILGIWQLNKTSKFELSKTKFDLSNLCLSHLTASLCATGNMKFTDSKGSANIELKNFDTTEFRKAMPPEFKLIGVINANTNVTLVANQKLPNVTGYVVTNKGFIASAVGKGRIKEDINKLRLDYKLTNSKLDAKADIDINNVIKATILAKSDDVIKQNFKSNIKLNMNNLSFLHKALVNVEAIKGNITGDVNVDKTGHDFVLSGGINLKDGSFDLAQMGTQIRDLNLGINAKHNNLQIVGTAKTAMTKQNKQGQLAVNGEINPFTQQGHINIKGNDFRVADSHTLMVELTPDMNIVLDKTIKVVGEIKILNALIKPVMGESKTTISDDVVDPTIVKPKESYSPIDADVKITLGDNVSVSSADFTTRLYGGIEVVAKPQSAPIASGEIHLKAGAIRIYGQELNIERGRILFGNGPIDNPSLDIRASRAIEDEDVIVGASVLGTVNTPAISLFSTPSMPNSSILSYLIFGKAPNSSSFSTTAVLQTTGVVGANTIAKDLKNNLGLDVLDFSLSGMEAGKNLTNKIYVGMESNFFDNINQILLKYKLNKRLRLEAIGSTENSSADFIYSYEKD